jgi:hypothetical protein
VRYAFLFAALAAAVVAAVACGTGGIERLSGDGNFDLDAGNGVILGPDNLPAPTGPAGSGLATGLPCDVQALFENRCIGCHEGKTPNAPRLLEYADLTAPSVADPRQTMAEMALVRMKSTTSPMPPAPAAPPDADEIATMEEWVAAGTPKGALCTDIPPDGGTDSGIPAAVDAGPDAAPACLSGVMWALGDTGSASMHPGRACNSCHQQQGGPNLGFAGTVYRAAHDVDDCNGANAPPPLTIEITDRYGRKISTTANDAGNFNVRPPQQQGQQNRFRAPFRAKIIDGAKTRVMNGSVTSGDCNSCHSVNGRFGAPGRVLAP